MAVVDGGCAATVVGAADAGSIATASVGVGPDALKAGVAGGGDGAVSRLQERSDAGAYGGVTEPMLSLSLFD